MIAVMAPSTGFFPHIFASPANARVHAIVICSRRLADRDAQPVELPSYASRGKASGPGPGFRQGFKIWMPATGMA